LIEPLNDHLSVRRQCELLDINRSSFYLQPAAESEENLRLMRLIDQQFLRTPFYGSRRMTASLERSGETVNRKRVQRLMAQMGLEAIFPRPRTTIAATDARVYPYLLRDRELTRLEEAGIAVSRNCRGRALDILFVERLWRSVKYEHIYIKNYEHVKNLESGLTAYFWFCDEKRLHQSLDYRSPAEVNRGGSKRGRGGEKR
jgi:putative transposase